MRLHVRSIAGGKELAAAVLPALLILFLTVGAEAGTSPAGSRLLTEGEGTAACSAAPTDSGAAPAGPEAPAEGTLSTDRSSSVSAADSSGTPARHGNGWLRRAGRVALGVFGRALLYAALLVGLLLIPLGLGGTFVMVGAAAVFGAATGFGQITLKFLGVLLGLALVGEGLESLLGVAVARKYGASKWGMWGAFLGGIAGALVGTPVPVAGNLVGALIGVFAGAFIMEWLGRGRSDAGLRAGWGALLGRTAASAIKLGIGMIILVLVVKRSLW